MLETLQTALFGAKQPHDTIGRKANAARARERQTAPGNAQ
jgi:hypothetical protein